jgi:hypothetical protein
VEEQEPDRWQKAKHALQPLAVNEIQVAGALSDSVAVQLGIPTRVRTVLIHPDVVQHILTQREGGLQDAEFVLTHMADAIGRPHYCGRDPRQHNRFDLVFRVESEERNLFVAVKLVLASAAATSQDELWVSTGYPLGADFLRRKRWRETLQTTTSVNP